jgi:hypothetical protein
METNYKILELSPKTLVAQGSRKQAATKFMTQLFSTHSPLREASCIISKVNF